MWALMLLMITNGAGQGTPGVQVQSVQVFETKQLCDAADAKFSTAVQQLLKPTAAKHVNFAMACMQTK